MSEKFKVGDNTIPHFVTFSVVGWLDVFSRESYKETFIESLRFCTQNKGLILHAWVIMTNHVHLIISSSKETRISDLVRDIKKYTSRQIVSQIQQNPVESRRKWMTNIFSFIGKHNSHNDFFQFWQQDYHPIELNSNKKLDNYLEYLHENPVKSGLVWEAWHYKYSSAIDYYTEEKGLLEIDLISQNIF